MACHKILSSPSYFDKQKASQLVSICSANPWQTTNLHTSPTKVVNLTAHSLVKLFSITSSMDYGLVLFSSKDVKLRVFKNKNQPSTRCMSTNVKHYVGGSQLSKPEFMCVHSDYQLLTACVCRQPFYNQPNQLQHYCSTEATTKLII